MSTASIDTMTGWRSATRAVFIVLAGVCLATLGWYGGADADDAHSAIVIDSGPLKGTSVDGVREYLGIPYAAPPVGSLRWMPPQSFGKWKGLLQATQFGSECPQPSGGNENCLFLNVYAPADAEKNDSKKGGGRAVMVWIHGGGMTEGGADLYDPSPLVQAGGVVVVTINYRLGILGFFAHPAIDVEGHLAGNYGINSSRWVGYSEISPRSAATRSR